MLGTRPGGGRGLGLVAETCVRPGASWGWDVETRGRPGGAWGAGARGYWGIWRWDKRAPCTAVELASEGFGVSGMESESLGRAGGSGANLQSKDCRGWAWGWRL